MHSHPSPSIGPAVSASGGSTRPPRGGATSQAAAAAPRCAGMETPALPLYTLSLPRQQAPEQCLVSFLIIGDAILPSLPSPDIWLLCLLGCSETRRKGPVLDRRPVGCLGAPHLPEVVPGTFLPARQSPERYVHCRASKLFVTYRYNILYIADLDSMQLDSTSPPLTAITQDIRCADGHGFSTSSSAFLP